MLSASYAAQHSAWGSVPPPLSEDDLLVFPQDLLDSLPQFNLDDGIFDFLASGENLETRKYALLEPKIPQFTNFDSLLFEEPPIDVKWMTEEDQIPLLEDVPLAEEPVTPTLASETRNDFSFETSEIPFLIEEEVVCSPVYSEPSPSYQASSPPYQALSPAYQASSPATSAFSDEPVKTGNACQKRKHSVASTSSYSAASPANSEMSSDFAYEPPRKAGRRAKFSQADKRERKRAQNRDAAERYRIKKKQLVEVVGGEEQELMDRNLALKTDVAKLEAEVSCLKKLMRDMLKANGIEIPKKRQ